jgi:hypothetical protein
MSADKEHSRVSPEGIKAGLMMVRIVEPTIQKLAADGENDTRCKSCAFRAGTVPNGCIQTQLDVTKAVIEDVPFLCHQADRKGQICHGWFAARVAMNEASSLRGGEVLQIRNCPWEFSPADEQLQEGSAA